MRTTVLLLSRDDAGYLRHSLPAAKQQAGADVYVIDNASCDRTQDLVREHRVECLRLERRHTYCQAINAGLAATGGDAVLLLNADCFLEPGFLGAAGPRLREPRVGSVAGMLLRTRGPGPDQRLDRIDTAGIRMYRCRKNVLAGHDCAPSAWTTVPEVFGPDGAAALYRRETLQDCMIDGSVLDDDFEAWASDVDLAWRAQLLGWRCVFEPRAVGYHVRTYRPDTRDGMPRRDRRLVFRNRYVMIAKNDLAADLAPDLHHLLAYEMLVLGHVLLREPHLLLAYLEAARLLPKARRKRTVLQRRRRARAVGSVRFDPASWLRQVRRSPTPRAL